MKKKYKVLVLQGGGYYGLIGITFLSYLGNRYDILKDIDSISGCSIGGIIACALMNGNTAEQIQKVFIQDGGKIFKRRNRFNLLDIPWYSDKGLKQSLQKLMCGKTLGQTKDKGVSLFVPALNMTKGKLKVYDNIDGKDDGYKLTDISLDTSAAMIYFPIRKNLEGDAIVDGGIRQVCPIMTHVIGLKKKLGINFQDMDVFVICAGNNINKKGGNYAQVKKWGIYEWLTKWIINDITISNQNTSKFWGQNIGFNSFEWFNPIMVSGELDDIKEKDYILTQCEMYKELFLDKWQKFIKR